jgi:hypothetical protein
VDDRMTADRTKTICPPIFDLEGIYKALLLTIIFVISALYSYSFTSA